MNYLVRHHHNRLSTLVEIPVHSVPPGTWSIIAVGDDGCYSVRVASTTPGGSRYLLGDPIPTPTVEIEQSQTKVMLALIDPPTKKRLNIVLESGSEAYISEPLMVRTSRKGIVVAKKLQLFCVGQSTGNTDPHCTVGDDGDQHVSSGSSVVGSQNNTVGQLLREDRDIGHIASDITTDHQFANPAYVNGLVVNAAGASATDVSGDGELLPPSSAYEEPSVDHARLMFLEQPVLSSSHSDDGEKGKAAHYSSC